MQGGTAGAPLTIENYPGEQPVIDLGEYYPLARQRLAAECATAIGTSRCRPIRSLANMAPATAATQPYYGVTVQIAGRLRGVADPMDATRSEQGPPTAFTNPDPAYYVNGQLAYDLTWYNPATTAALVPVQPDRPDHQPRRAVRRGVAHEQVRRLRILGHPRRLADSERVLSASN